MITFDEVPEGAKVVFEMAATKAPDGWLYFRDIGIDPISHYVARGAVIVAVDIIKPPEPTNLGAVLEDTDDNLAVLVAPGTATPWFRSIKLTGGGERREWLKYDDISVKRIVKDT